MVKEYLVPFAIMILQLFALYLLLYYMGNCRRQP